MSESIDFIWWGGGSSLPWRPRDRKQLLPTAASVEQRVPHRVFTLYAATIGSLSSYFLAQFIADTAPAVVA